MIGLRRRTIAGCATAVLALGIVGCSPLKPYDSKPIEQGIAGVLWATTYYKKGWSFERATYATVTSVDGVENQKWSFPINLTPGRHSIEVRYDRENWFCGYLGCGRTEKARKSFDLLVEAQHSYIPFARRFCDQDWMGILDTGRPARDDLATWRDWKRGLDDLTRDAASHVVVAGEGHPATCDAP